MRRSGIVLFALLIQALGADLIAQGIPDPEAVQELTAFKSFTCSFSIAASAEFSANGPVIESGTQATFEFNFDDIDYAGNRARLIGNVAAGDVVAVRGLFAVSFVEQTPAGTPNLTTVYPWKNGAGDFLAVHSRHTVLLASQAYGSCRPR